MFEGQLQGQLIDFHRTADPPGGWAFTVSDQVLAELAWSHNEQAVRIECAEEVWRARFSRGRVFNGVLETSGRVPLMLYGGGVAAGVAMSRSGVEYELFVAFDWRRGPWSGIDDVNGDAVLRARARLGLGGFRFEVGLSPDSRHRSDLGALLCLWGSLRILRHRRPLARVVPTPTTRRAGERALGRLLESMA